MMLDSVGLLLQLLTWGHLALCVPVLSKYFALEIAHDISEEQRAAYMVEWWTQAHDLLLAQGISQHRIAEIIEASRADGTMELRKGAKPFLQLLHAHSIPVCIFSAGLKETIRQCLTQEDTLLPNVHLIGNEMVFDEQTGILSRFTDDLITSSSVQPACSLHATMCGEAEGVADIHFG